jgi:hypothetical protein
VLAGRSNHASELAARRKRQRRLELIFVLDDENIREVDARRLDVDDDLVGTRCRRGQFFDDERFRRPVLPTDNSLHGHGV